MAIMFRVFGVAASKGSMKVIRGRITDSNRSVAGWQQLVAEAANHALAAVPSSERAVLARGVRLTVAFYLPRPKKYARPGISVAHMVAPDLSKLIRAVEDALTGVVYRDDAQIVELLATKQYAAITDLPHIDVRVEATNGEGALEVPAAPQGLIPGVLFP